MMFILHFGFGDLLGLEAREQRSQASEYQLLEFEFIVQLDPIVQEEFGEIGEWLREFHLLVAVLVVHVPRSTS